MDSSNPGPLLGRFKAENAENILKAYRIVMDVKETGKSYILQLVDLKAGTARVIFPICFRSLNGLSSAKQRAAMPSENGEMAHSPSTRFKRGSHFILKN